MRIISGKYKIRQIAAPKNFTARPTTDFAKENIFNVLNNYYDFEGLTALDLFAGTGSLSYEFASRGCASVTTVEMNSDHFRFILSVIKQLNISEIIPVRMDVFRVITSYSIHYTKLYETGDTNPSCCRNRHYVDRHCAP